MADPKPPPVPARAARYAAFVDRHRVAILAAALGVAVLSTAVAATLPVYSDFSHLLPPSTQSVQDLHKLEKRSRVLGTLMIAVKSDDPAHRAAAAQRLRETFEAFPKELVSSVTFDESVEREYAWDHRWLFASLADLTAARDALQKEIDRKKLEENPLWIDFEDEKQPEAGAAAEDKLAALEKKLKDAEATHADPGPKVSKDKTLQLMVLRTPFSSSDVDLGTRLLAESEKALAKVRAESPPGVTMGLAGDVAVAKSEHDAILNGILISTLVTIALCIGALLLYFRTGPGVLALSAALTVGTLFTFAWARVAVGHLNLATAFLSPIVVGNGVNFGIMLLSRHMEARREGRGGLDAVAAAVAGAMPGTLAAALTAVVAYGSLMITDFRGFRHFGLIAGPGMLFCWVTAFTVLPACLAVGERRGWIKARREPRLGPLLGRLLPRRLGLIAWVGLVLTAWAGFETWRYLAHDPFETNFKNLRSESSGLKEERHWMNEIDNAFGQGISGGFAIALDRRDDVEPAMARLRAADEGKPDQERLFSRINSIDDLLPSDQPEKIKVLRQIGDLLSEDVLANMSEAERADALRLKPPADLRPLVDTDIPELIAWPFTEPDGSRGKVILAMSGWGYEIWNAHDLVRFSRKARALDLPRGTVLGGMAFVFADMIALVERDGPTTTLAAALGALLVVALTMGVRRHGAITMMCCATGTLLMLAIGSLVGLKVNFLDFVALPITIGIGIDYSVNMVARERQEGPGSARNLLRTTGGAVFLCSYTTIVGYGSLLTSVNKGIKSFGAAAILGEITCLATALWLAPALLAVFGRPNDVGDALKVPEPK